MESEITPSIMNSPMISKAVYHTNEMLYSYSTVLNKIIDTISLNMPSPKIQLNSLGC
jgi:hypothetical protein